MGDRSREGLSHDFWRSTENVNRLLDSSPDSMFVSRIDNFQFVEVNQRAVENYGYSREEFLHMQIFDIEVEAPVMEEVGKLYNMTPIGEVIEVEGVNRRKDGSIFHVQVRFCKLDDEYAVACVRDITLQKQADEELEKRVEERTLALLESEMRLAEILDGAEEAIISVDVNQNIVLFNKGAERIFGFKETEVIGQPLDILLPTNARSVHRLNIDIFSDGPVSSKQISERVSVLGKRKNGKHFPVEASISKIDVGGKRFFTAFLRDVTERRRLEKEVLEISERERRRVGQDLHDDLGQHLTGICFMVEELVQKAAEQHIADEVDRLETLINLIEEARTKTRNLSRGLYPIELETSGFGVVIRNLAAQIEKVYGISCLVSDDQYFSIDDIGIGEALYHIAQEAITNSVRHAQPSRIDITLKKEEGEIVMTVEDDGCGLKGNFEKGGGMGIRIMQYRARLINGTLAVERSPGGGAMVKCVVSDKRAMNPAEDDRRQ